MNALLNLEDLKLKFQTKINEIDDLINLLPQKGNTSKECQKTLLKELLNCFEKGVVILEEEDLEIDLFQNFSDLPENVQSVINRYNHDNLNYSIVEQFLKELEVIGYTFEYGLDSIPFNLKKVENK